MAIDERSARVQVAPAQHVDRKVVANGRAQDPVEARIIRLALGLLGQHDADPDRARRILPVGDDIGHIRIVRVDRLDDGEPAGMGPLHFHGIAGVVAVQGKGGDEDRAVDADLVHRRHHLVSRDVIGPVRHTVPRSLRRVRLIGMDLGIDNRHRGSSSVPGEFGQCSRFVSRGQRRRALPVPMVVSSSSTGTVVNSAQWAPWIEALALVAAGSGGDQMGRSLRSASAHRSDKRHPSPRWVNGSRGKRGRLALRDFVVLCNRPP
jgi:hypothetical protein